MDINTSHKIIILDASKENIEYLESHNLLSDRHYKMLSRIRRLDLYLYFNTASNLFEFGWVKFKFSTVIRVTLDTFKLVQIAPPELWVEMLHTLQESKPCSI